jgi:hypothetical protein
MLWSAVMIAFLLAPLGPAGPLTVIAINTAGG